MTPLQQMEDDFIRHKARRELIDRIDVMLDAARLLVSKPAVCGALLSNVAAEAQRLESWLERGTI